MKVIGWYGHTGNFVLEAAGLKKAEVKATICRSLGTTAAVLTINEVTKCRDWIKSYHPPPSASRMRPTRGLIFMVEGPCSLGDVKSTMRAKFIRKSTQVVGAWKRDVLNLGGTLDRNYRRGGWGALATDVSRQVGGNWTARSLRTVEGLLARAM